MNGNIMTFQTLIGGSDIRSNLFDCFLAIDPGDGAVKLTETADEGAASAARWRMKIV